MYEVTERVLAERPTAVIRARLEITQIDSWIGPALQQVTAAVAAAGTGIAGPPFARRLPVEGTAAGYDLEAGFPVTAPLPAVAGAAVQPCRLPGGAVAVTLHQGPYDALQPAYEALEKWLADRGAVPDGLAWEIYLTAPVGDPLGWRTEVVQPFTDA